MNALLYIILGIICLFIVIFIGGFIFAWYVNKKENPFGEHAKLLLEELSEKETTVIKMLWQCFRQNNPNRANDVVSTLTQEEVIRINTILDPNSRPPVLSSGKLFDNTTWFAYFNKATELGFSDDASKIIAGIGLNGLDEQF